MAMERPRITSILIISCFFLIQSLVVQGQQPDYFFKRLRTGDGLSHNKVNCVLQDKKGFLWIGTEDGLNRYDGRFFTVYRHGPADAASLSGNTISDLYEDRDGIIWIATKDGGITKYDDRAATEKPFKSFRHDDKDPKSIPDNHIKKIVEDRFGCLWLASARNYVIRFNKKTERFDIPARVGTRGILALALDDRDTLWAGREGGGLLKINTRTLKYQSDKRYEDLYAKLPHVSIPAIYKDSYGRMWCSSWDKDIFSYAAKTEETATYPKDATGSHFPKDMILSFAEDADHRIWMAGDSSGVSVYDPKSGSLSNFRNNPFDDGSIAGDHVNVVYIDRKGTVWIGTNNGLSCYNPLFYPFKRHFLDKPETDLHIYAFYADSDRRLWIGTNEGLYIKYPGKNGHAFRKLVYKGQKLAVTQFFKDTDGTFYLGTDYTLFTYNERNNTVSPLPNTEQDPVMRKLIGSRIVSIVRDTLDGHPGLMVSPYGHYLAYYDLVEKKWVSRSDSTRKIISTFGLKDHLVPKLYNSHRKLWLASSSFGLGEWDYSKTQRVSYLSNNPTNPYSISSNYIFDILADGKNSLWVSTYGGGLNRFDEQTKKFFHVPYSSNLTEGLQTDNKKNVWMICNGHIHKYEPLDSVYSCYDLPSLQKTEGLKGYMYKDAEGNLYAAGGNYYIVFQPENVKKVDYSPRVYFTDFRIFDQSQPHLLHHKTIQLDYSLNYFSLTFSAPDFSGDNVQYAYMLKGFDKRWIDAGKFNVANYSNLPGGTYEFLVQARNWKGTFTGPYQSVIIKIIPPFWERWWFFACALATFFLAFYGINCYRMNVRKKQLMIRNSIAKDLHDQVGSTLSSIAIYAEVAKIYHKQQNPLALTDLLTNITESANEMIGEMGDIVWALNSKNDHFGSIVKRIEAYARPLCKAKNIDFEIVCPTVLEEAHLGMKERKNLFLIMKEAINNAVKYAQGSRVWIDIRKAGKEVTIAIHDNGLGFDTGLYKEKKVNSLRGNGLPNMQLRADELHARIKMKSNKGKGTSIDLSFDITD